MNVQNVYRFVPGFKPGDEALTDTSPEQLPAANLDARHQQAIDALLGSYVSDKCRKRCQQIMSVYPAGVLENLKDHGLTFDIIRDGGALGMGPGGTVALGGYDPTQKKIIFGENVLMTKTGRHVLTHELIHAIDHMRGIRHHGESKTPLLDSTKDGDLAKLYAGYLARGAVEAISQLRYAIESESNGTLPEKAHITGEDNWGAMDVQYERKDGRETFRIEQQPRHEGSLIEKLMGAEAPDRVARELPHTEVDIQLHKGGTAHVVQDGTVSTITLRDGGVSYTGDVWSEYAQRSGMVEEYVAEAFSFYLEQGNVRDEMEMADPGMFACVEKTLQEEFKVRP